MIDLHHCDPLRKGPVQVWRGAWGLSQLPLRIIHLIDLYILKLRRLHIAGLSLILLSKFIEFGNVRGVCVCTRARAVGDLVTVTMQS